MEVQHFTDQGGDVLDGVFRFCVETCTQQTGLFDQLRFDLKGKGFSSKFMPKKYNLYC